MKIIIDINRKLFALTLLSLFTIQAKSQNISSDFPLFFAITVSNPLDVSRENVMVIIAKDQILKAKKNFNPNAFIVMDGNKEIPSQYNSKDEVYRGIVFVLDVLAKRESREITIKYNPTGTNTHEYRKRTQAELSHKVGGKFENREYIGGEFKNVDHLQVPPEHKDHSWFIRYEGPGWESDKVAYRFYLDWRDANDVFGKTTHDMVLQNVGLDGFDSYHELQSWGMDVMKVGKSLGIGTLATFKDGHAIRVDKTDSMNSRIIENGNVYSAILTNYKGWQVGQTKTDVQTRLTIHAGTRLTHELVTTTPAFNDLCTGIVKDTLAKVLTSKGDAQHFGYIATYGKQSLHKDELGLAVFFTSKAFVGFTEDEFSHGVKLEADKGKLDYYFLAAWVLEPEGIKDEKQFIEYLNNTAKELANPVKIEINSK